MRFHTDTEVRCNMIPIDLYKKASKNYQLKHVKPANTCRLRRIKTESSGTSTYPSMAWQPQVSTGLQARSQERNSPSNWQKGCVWMKIIHIDIKWHQVTSCSLITELKAIFSQYGIPDIIVTDNSPQFLTAEFAVFEYTCSSKPAHRLLTINPMIRQRTPSRPWNGLDS